MPVAADAADIEALWLDPALGDGIVDVSYHTVPVGTLDPAARRRLDGGEVDWVAFTASSTVEGFLRGYGGPPPPGTRVAAIGPVTAGTALSAGIPVATTATEHTIGGLVAAIEHAVVP